MRVGNGRGRASQHAPRLQPRSKRELDSDRQFEPVAEPQPDFQL